MYEHSCEIIYQMISTRIRERRDSMHLTNKQLCPAADPHLISAIVANRRDDKKNKYLIPDGTKCTYKSYNDTPFVDIIASKLSYKSTSELLIGTEKELESYSGFLFCQLIKDAIEYESENNRKKIHALLTDYIPYAKAASYYEILDKYGDIVSYLITDDHKADIVDCTIKQNYAIARLYHLVKHDFSLLFTVFFTEQPNTTKLNKRLSNFVTSTLLPVMINSRHQTPIISDAKEMLNKNYELLVRYTNYELSISPETIGYHENDHDVFERNNFQDRINAGMHYIDTLENIQIRNEKEPDLALLDNHWNSSMCLKAQ